MSEAIIVALITGIVAVIGSFFTFLAQSKQIQATSKKTQEEQIASLRKDITSTLDAHRTEYLNGISDVKDTITEFQGSYQQMVAVIELKIDNLEKKQDKHNNLIERTYKLESDVEVMKEKQSVANHRIDDLEHKI